MFLSITLIALIAGIFIGTIGIGGVILVPLLSYMLNIDLHIAMAASSMSFLFPALVGTFTYAKRGSITWEAVLWLSIGVIPAALFGARLNTDLDSDALILIVAGLIAFSGINVFANRQSDSGTIPDIRRLPFVLIGALVGFGSSLTGTGGPVLLVPILITLGYSALKTIGISQAIQLPIAVFAAAGYWLYGQLDWSLGIHLGIAQAIGVFIGAQIAHRLPVFQLRRLVAIALIGIGLLMIWQIIN